MVRLRGRGRAARGVRDRGDRSDEGDHDQRPARPGPRSQQPLSGGMPHDQGCGRGKQDERAHERLDTATDQSTRGQRNQCEHRLLQAGDTCATDLACDTAGDQDPAQGEEREVDHRSGLGIRRVRGPQRHGERSHRGEQHTEQHRKERRPRHEPPARARLHTRPAGGLAGTSGGGGHGGPTGWRRSRGSGARGRSRRSRRRTRASHGSHQPGSHRQRAGGVRAAR